MTRQVRAQLRAVIALAGIALVGLAVGDYIVAHQRLNWPSWVPVLGKHDFILRARLTSVQGVLPGQGQAVTVSGVKVGQIASVGLDHGLAVATMRIEPRYAHIYPNATVLLRPKTGLKDMVAELDPGNPSSGAALRSGATLGSQSTLPDVNLDEILASLDSDTRDYLDLLVGDAGQTLGHGGGANLADVFRRFDPLSRDVARATSLVELRRARLRRVVANLSQLAVELGDRDRQLAQFVDGSEGVFRRFARQDRNLQSTIRLLPPALQSSNRALAKVNTLGTTLHSTLSELDPAARALAPTLRDIQPFLRTTTPVLQKSIRPFAREAQPTAKLLVPAAHNLAQATPNLTTLSNVLNAIVNELAYKPRGAQQSYLFYLPWAAHDTNSTVANQDGVTPLQRGMVFVGCGSEQFLETLTDPNSPSLNPTLATLIDLLNAPNYRQLIANKQCPFTPPPSAARGAP
jgi:phospholipid/cholesterol/gamma-HCH transport system substrate-binding protein